MSRETPAKETQGKRPKDRTDVVEPRTAATVCMYVNATDERGEFWRI
jgi:hypothetical protein